MVFLVIGSGVNIFARTIKNAQHEAELARGEAEQANQAKDHFLAMLSHELRTPLGPILLSASAMEKDEAIAEPIRNEISMIRRNVDLETRLIDDLLDVTRISKGKLQMQLKTVDAHKVLAEAVATVRHEAESKGLSVTLHLEAKEHNVSADSARLQQVFWNLIRNAAKFTERGGNIDIGSGNGSDGQFMVRIADTGIGIAPEVLPKVFNAFEQGGDNRTRRFGGLGLGLTISKGLVELHSGKLSAMSDGLGKGTTMVVELPVTSERVSEAVTEISEKPKVDARILIVEDDLDQLATIPRVLGRLGYEVKGSSSAAMALRSLGDAPGSFDLVLTDFDMPGVNGVEFARRLLAEHPGLPVVMVSGRLHAGEMPPDLPRNILRVLAKPYSQGALSEVLRDILGSA